MDEPETLCALCRAVDEEAREIRRIYDTHLTVSEHFVVIPSLGPVTAGHVMVVSRSHAPNLAAMGQSVIDEYNALVESISARPGFGDLLEGEHGAAADSPGGACITHAHVNLIPGFGHLLNELEFTLPPIEMDYELRNLGPDAAPYILLRGSNAVRLYGAHAVPSQLIRRVLFAKIGRGDWDWGAYPNLSVIHETLELWGDVTNG